MTLKGFKSFASATTLRLEPGITCVVGPNGSGKSNVIDSVLFVFGKRAQQIRLKKISELIHKSSKYPSLKYCKVTINFADLPILVKNIFS